MRENIIECNGLTKIYKHQKALDHLDLTIPKGEIYGLIGQNGAGKSTMMKLLSGLIHPSEGDFRLFGNAPNRDPFMYRRVGSLIEEAGLYLHMSGIHNMHIKALAMGCDNTKELSSLLALCGLRADNRKKVRAYSLGMKQRLGLALSMIGNPELLILDEPVNGLDPQGINDMRMALQRLNRERGVTIIISSHILEELSKIATSYGIIKDGVLIQNMSKEDLENSCKDYCRIVVDHAQRASVILEELIHPKHIEVREENSIYLYDQVDTSVLVEHLVRQQIRIYEVTMHKQNLEAYFLDVTGGDHHVE